MDYLKSKSRLPIQEFYGSHIVISKKWRRQLKRKFSWIVVTSVYLYWPERRRHTPWRHERSHRVNERPPPSRAVSTSKPRFRHENLAIIVTAWEPHNCEKGRRHWGHLICIWCFARIGFEVNIFDVIWVCTLHNWLLDCLKS